MLSRVAHALGESRHEIARVLVHREQSYEQTRTIFDEARRLGYVSVNIDLIYGLPFQNLANFRETLALALTLKPDRVACYGYAHVPWLRPHQKEIAASDLPSAELKFELFGASVEAFLGAGYDQIGMDHFALPDDELAAAAQMRGRELRLPRHRQTPQSPRRPDRAARRRLTA